MKLILVTLSALAFALIDPSGCNSGSTSGPTLPTTGLPSPPPPGSLIQVQLGDDDALPKIGPQITLEFDPPHGFAGSFWVQFKKKNPCQGSSSRLDSRSGPNGQIASCSTKNQLAGKNFPYIWGPSSQPPPPTQPVGGVATDGIVRCGACN